jgi:uncharacterized protein YoxC
MEDNNELQKQILELQFQMKEVLKAVTELEKARQQQTQFSVDLQLLTRTVSDLASVVKDLKTEVKDLKIEMKTVESQDGEKWRTYTKYIGTTVVGGIIAYILSKLKLK